MQERMSDPHFNPGTLAREEKISLRTLHSVFAGYQTSFAKELLAMRMRQARNILDKRVFDKKSISELSALIGYSSSNLFIRHFRKIYGLPPKAYRDMRKS